MIKTRRINFFNKKNRGLCKKLEHCVLDRVSSVVDKEGTGNCGKAA